MIAFDVHYDPVEAGVAMRQFHVRSLTRLRPVRTFAPPIGFAVFLALGVALKQPSRFVLLWAVMLALSVASPTAFYFLYPAMMRRETRRFPERHVELQEDALVLVREGRTAVIPWPRVAHVWQLAGHEMLVLGSYGVIPLPLRDVPPGAHEFILAHAGKASVAKASETGAT